MSRSCPAPTPSARSRHCDRILPAAEAAIIGEVAEAPEETVLLTTLFGGSRILDMLVGEQLPRIC